MARTKSKKIKRKVKVPIRKWLAALFGVHSESVSRWIGLGHLRSYEPADVRDFLVKNPRLLTQDSRVRRMRKDKGVLRPHRTRRTASRKAAARPAARKAAPSSRSGKAASGTGRRKA